MAVWNLKKKQLRTVFYLFGVSVILMKISERNKEKPVDILATLNWQTVPLANERDLYVYSAFYDDIQETGPVIKITAVGRKHQLNYNVTCTSFFSDLSPSTVSSGRVVSIREWHGSFYVSKWLFCDVVDDRVPSAVNIMGIGPQYANVKVYNPQKAGVIGSIGVCVRPLHKSFDDVAVLVEFIELYLILGASHFTFYNQSISEFVSRALHYYQSRHLVTVLDYDLPVYNQTVANGQYTVLQDCFLRARGVHQYVLIVDVDEFILPRKHSSLQEIVAIYNASHMGALNFASLTFCNNFKKNHTVQDFLQARAREKKYFGSVSLKLKTQELTFRANKPCPIPDKSKMIVDPWKIDETGVHFVTKFKKGYKRLDVDASIAMVHHYRSCPDNKWLGRCPPFPDPEADVTAHQHLHTLINRELDVFLDIGL